MEDQPDDTHEINFGRFPFGSEIDTKLLTDCPEIFNVKHWTEAVALLERHLGHKPTNFQVMKVFTYSKLLSYDGLVSPVVNP